MRVKLKKLHKLPERFEIRLAGSGGQGLIKAGLILAEAATMEGKKVVQLQSYGPEARGGASRSDVLIGSEIDYPGVTQLDFLLALTQEAYDKYLPLMKRGGIVVFDSAAVKPKLVEGIEQHSVNFTKIAKEVGNRIFANMVALGYIVAITKIVNKESVKKIIRKVFPKELAEKNVEAFEKGYLKGLLLISSLTP